MKKSKILFSAILTMLISLCFLIAAGAATANLDAVSKVKTVATANNVTISWGKVKNAKGYKVTEKVKGKWVDRVSTTSSACIITDLDAGEKHTFRITAYTKKGSSTVLSKKYKVVNVLTKPGNIKTLKATVKGTAVTLKWNKAVGATAYRVYKYNSAKKTWSTVISSTSKCSATIKNLKKSTKYTFAVRSLAKLSDKTIFSAAYTKATVKTPSETSLVMGTGGAVGTYFNYGTVLGKQIQKSTNININVVSTAGSAANIVGIDDGCYKLAIAQSDILNYAWKGINSYEFDGAISSLRAICGLYPEEVHLITTNPQIDSVYDLANKKVAIGAPGSSLYYNSLDILKAAGISDKIYPYYCSFADAADALKDGNIDAAFTVSGVPANIVQEFCNTVKAYFVPIEGNVAKKLMSSLPYYTQSKIPKYTYANQSKSITTVSVKSTLIVNKSVSEEDVYKITKSIFSNAEKISKAHSKGKYLSFETATKGITIPFHKGAAKYFAENGYTVKSK